MDTLWLISYVLLWAVVLFLGFLLLGTLRALGLLRWRLEQLQATSPRRLGRDGLKPGTRAPDFSLPSAAGGEASLRDFAGRRVLLVFMQVGCGPCQAIVPELNRAQRKGDARVLVVNNGEPEAVRRWAHETGARFPVLAQQAWAVSRRYEVFATPFGFVIDEQGMIRAKGIVTRGRYLQFLLSEAEESVTEKDGAPVPAGAAPETEEKEP